MPMPTASSPRARTTPRGTAMCWRGPMRAWMGLLWADSFSWDWMEVGLFLSKNPGLASFWRPAKVKVTPRKARNGSRAQPAEVDDGGEPTRRRQAGPSPSFDVIAGQPGWLSSRSLRGVRRPRDHGRSVRARQLIDASSRRDGAPPDPDVGAGR